MERIGIQAPEYFPGLQYLALMARVPRFVLLDTLPYRRHTFFNRTRIRTPQGWQWLTVPLHRGRQALHRMQPREEEPWRRKHFHALAYNYRATPFFEYYEPELEAFFARPYASLAELAEASLRLLMQWLDIRTPVLRASALPGAPASVPEVLAHFPEHRPVMLPEAMVPGRDPEGITEVFRYEEQPRHQRFPGFVAGLSALDALFNYGPEARSFL